MGTKAKATNNVASTNNATTNNAVASTNNTTTTNVVAVKNIKVVDIYRTKFDNNIVVQTSGKFAGYDENGNLVDDSNRFTIAPLRFIKECNFHDENVQMVYALCTKSLGVDTLLTIARLVLLNSTISIKRTFVPKGTEEGQDEDRYHTDIVACSNSKNVLQVLPLVQMVLTMKPKQETNILNAFNI